MIHFEFIFVQDERNSLHHVCSALGCPHVLVLEWPSISIGVYSYSLSLCLLCPPFYSLEHLSICCCVLLCKDGAVLVMVLCDVSSIVPLSQDCFGFLPPFVVLCEF